MKDRDPVSVFDRTTGRWVKTWIDSMDDLTWPQYGWVSVVGWPGHAGPVSVPAANVRPR